MAGNIRIFVGYPLALEPFCVLLSSARCYRLKPDADLAVVPFDDDLQDALHDRFGTGDWPENQGVLLSTTDQAFAAECSQRAPLAYLQCDDGAEGVFQSAAVWKAGPICRLCRSAACPIGAAGAPAAPRLCGRSTSR